MRIRLATVALTLLSTSYAHADPIDDVVKAEMQRRQIPGLSIAIIDGGKIVKAQGYGVTERGAGTAVTPSTLFQAGSVSKSVAALGALHLVSQGKLALDEDVNQKLLTWKVPDNQFTVDKKVTLRGLLSHSAGLTVHGFPGYASDVPVPTVVQVLDGAKPANTAPVRVDFTPGSKWRYSGGGYTVMQQLVADVTGKPFAAVMQQAVLKPMGMTASSFAQPPAAATARATAAGYYADRTPVAGRWHIYPEMAAAGLWTNPSDLARFAIGIQRSLAGTANPVIPAALTRVMLTDQKDGDGLGVFLKGAGKTLEFSHGGRDEGFDTLLRAFAETGQGVVIMINANDNSMMMQRISAAVARQYHWPASATPANASAAHVKLDDATLERYAGRYNIGNNRLVALTPKHGGLVTLSDGMEDEEFTPVGPLQFQSDSRDATWSIRLDARGDVIGGILTGGGHEQPIARVGPLMHTLKPMADAKPARTAAVKTVLDAAARGGSALADSPLATAGVKTDFGTRKIEELSGLESLTLLHEQDVSAQPLERHGGKVDKVLAYKAMFGGQPRYLLAYLTADNLFTDYDVVDD
ncbi:MAG TPA: serine hydrolase domain-containing protein [Telluria sp.]|nr:serine hydrolase domain-containing protein [Telluria sp.]